MLPLARGIEPGGIFMPYLIPSRAPIAPEEVDRFRLPPRSADRRREQRLRSHAGHSGAGLPGAAARLEDRLPRHGGPGRRRAAHGLLHPGRGRVHPAVRPAGLDPRLPHHGPVGRPSLVAPSRPQLHPDGPISRSPRCAIISLGLSMHGGYLDGLDGLDEGACGRGDRTGGCCRSSRVALRKCAPCPMGTAGPGTPTGIHAVASGVLCHRWSPRGPTTNVATRISPHPSILGVGRQRRGRSDAGTLSQPLRSDVCSIP